MYLPETEREDPYRNRKQRLSQCYRVRNRNTRNVFSRCTTKDKATRQLQYLQAYRTRKFRNALPRVRTTRHKSKRALQS